MLDPAGLLAWPARSCWRSPTCIWRRAAPSPHAAGMLPPYDTRETLRRLALALRRWQPARLIAARRQLPRCRAAPARLGRRGLRRCCAGCSAAIEVVWVLGQPRSRPAAPACRAARSRNSARHAGLPPRGAAARREPGGDLRPFPPQGRPCRRARRRDAALLPRRRAAPHAAGVRRLYRRAGRRATRRSPRLFPRGGRASCSARTAAHSFPSGRAGRRPRRVPLPERPGCFVGP